MSRLFATSFVFTYIMVLGSQDYYKKNLELPWMLGSRDYYKKKGHVNVGLELSWVVPR